MYSRKARMSHENWVKDLMWCFSLGDTRVMASLRIGCSRSQVDKIIKKERQLADLEGRFSRL
jgi:hypothetical protein